MPVDAKALLGADRGVGLVGTIEVGAVDEEILVNVIVVDEVFVVSGDGVLVVEVELVEEEGALVEEEGTLVEEEEIFAAV